MNDALYHYRDDQRVASIHGYSLPTDRPLPETYFLKGADCWGWATWRRAWGGFNPDGRALLSELERRHLVHHFDFRSEEHTSELQSLMRISYAVFCLKKTKICTIVTYHTNTIN